MATKLRSFSHSYIAKILAFALVIFCFTQTVTLGLNIINRSHLGITLEKSYYRSEDFAAESSGIINDLMTLCGYKNEENILTGATITEAELRDKVDYLYYEYQNSDNQYNPNLSERENYQIFLNQEKYKEEIEKVRQRLIQEDIHKYKLLLERLSSHEGLNYYIKMGDFELSNNPGSKQAYINYPAYIMFEGYVQKVYPQEIEDNPRYYWLEPDSYSQDYPDALYLGFNDTFLQSRIAAWQANKAAANNDLYQMTGFILGLMVSFIYLIIIWGRNYWHDQEVHFNAFDRLYNDFNVAICLALITLWLALCSQFYNTQNAALVYPTTMVIASIGLIFVLSLLKHIKNRTFLKHTLIYTILSKLFAGLKAIYNGGSLAMKVAVLVIGYPLCVALTFYIFPITIGAAVWLSFKKVKEFKAIKEGVNRVKEGDLAAKIEISGQGELAQLAGNINSITDGLNEAVKNEIKSERLKTELITNVSHDIRTPLTSIITYVDLLKKEEDPEKVKEYIEVLDQKSQRLKVLTDDLFEAAKASSGDIPVNFEKIDIAALLDQGLGELDEKVKARKLDFKLNFPKEKIFVKADGRLLWRAIENLFSNIFKYALEGSRVYVDLEELGDTVKLIIKNISAYELNISAAELMERFKRGDESRTSQGSGLGLSIVQSLIEIQKGSFGIEVDGDLFKATISLNKAEISLNKEPNISEEGVVVCD